MASRRRPGPASPGRRPDRHLKSGGMPEQLVELSVVEVLAAVPMRPGQESGLVVLGETAPPHRSLSIYIGQPEARAVQAAQRGVLPARPSTWDLYLSTLGALGARLARATIDRVEEQRHFFATIEVVQGEERHVLTCRPSDAIALAVREPACALSATEDVLLAAGRLPNVPQQGPEAVGP